MLPKRVLIINARSLLMESIAGFLESNGDGRFDVVSTLANNLPDLMNEIKEIEPGVIVMDEANSFITPAKLILSILEVQRVRLIALNSQTSKMDVYDKSQSVVSDPSEFLAAIAAEQ